MPDIKPDETPPETPVVPDPVVTKKPDDSVDLSADVTKFTPKEMVDYIDRLKDENAKRRIREKKAKESTEKTQTQLSSMQKELDKLSGSLQEYKKKEETESTKDATEREKLQKRVSDLQKDISEKETKLKEKDHELVSLSLKTRKQDRSIFVDSLITRLGHKFSSDYERNGFIESVSVLKDNEFELNDEETILKVNEFIKSTKKPPETPPAGPGSRVLEADTVGRVRALLAKKNFTADDQKELDLLTKEIDEKTK